MHRFCTTSMFKQKLPNGQIVARDWLLYSEKTGHVFWGLCLLLKNINSQFAKKEGFSDWKNSTARIKEHEGSHDHKKCVMDFTEVWVKKRALKQTVKESAFLSISFHVQHIH